ncbi:MAG: ABC transporter ATP-binding protein, partial [Clostridia bacterium]|nr:ABC transporter ATP-binding protein [Clostridia bacterium]
MNTQKTIAGTRSLKELQKQYSGAGKPGVPGGRGPMGGPGPRRGGGPGVRAKGKPKNMRATVIRLLSYVAKYRFQLILVFLFMFINTATSLYAGFQLRPIINTLIEPTLTAEQRIASLASTLLILSCVYAVGIVTNYVQARLMLKISQNTTEALRRDLFNAVQELPVRFFDGTPTGETMSRFTNDIDSIDMMINHSLTGMVSGVINLVGTFCMMLYTNVWLTIITIVFIPIFAKGGGAIAKLSTRYYSGQQAALGAVNGYIEESVSGQKVVKVFNHEDICVEEFTTLNNDMRDKQFRAQFWGGVMGPIMGNTSQISYALTAGIGGLLCLAGRFDVGGLVVFVNYSRQFSMPINMISQQMATIFSALACAERVFTVMDQTPEEPDRAGAQIMPA